MFRNTLKCIRKIQRMWLIRKEVRSFQLYRKAMRKIKFWWFKILFKRKLAKSKIAACKIQVFLRMVKARTEHLRILASSRTINRLIRGGIARKFSRKIKIIDFAMNVI